MILGEGQFLFTLLEKITYFLQNSQIFWRWLSEGGGKKGKKEITVADEIYIQSSGRNVNDKGLTQRFWKRNILQRLWGIRQY